MRHSDESELERVREDTIILPGEVWGLTWMIISGLVSLFIIIPVRFVIDLINQRRGA